MSQVVIKYIIMFSPPWEPNFAFVPLEGYDTESRAKERMESLMVKKEYVDFKFEIIEVPWEPWESDD